MWELRQSAVEGDFEPRSGDAFAAATPNHVAPSDSPAMPRDALR